MSVFDLLKNKVQKSHRKYQIVFPEGDDLRILNAASKLSLDNVVKPILLGSSTKITSLVQEQNLTFRELVIIDPAHYENKAAMVQSFINARGKKVDPTEVAETVKDPNYFGTMLVEMGLADGMVSGATHSTAATVRPALQLIHTAKGMKRVSGSFIMERHDEKYIFADCAINLDPDSQTLAEIAYQSVKTAQMINIDPKVAFLSFSTKGSAQADMVAKVEQAAEIFKQQHPDIPADGELQFDAAFVPEVAAKKAPESVIKGRANIFIFPELQSGNISYKIAQRLGNFAAIGPILQGLRKPVNDLSRGANTQDVYNIAVLTAAQALIRDEENEA